MFCPGCGSEDHQTSQFCRACGTDLRVVRTSLERPDSVTASAVSAREEIGRAVADRIRELEDARELKKVAEDVLPKIEKFLEAPEEKRLRRLRSGVITGLIGLAVGIPALALLSANPPPDWFIFLAYVTVFAAIMFATGLGLVINGLLFSRPRKGVADHSSDARLQNLIDTGYVPPQSKLNEGTPVLRTPTTTNLSARSSIAEPTTQHLKRDR